jgi:hypothetical protein
MNLLTVKYKTIGLIFLLWLFVGCDSPTPTLAPQRQPSVVNAGQGFTNNINFRIDSIRVLEDDGDSGNGGEFIFALLATRQANQKSAKLLMPGEGSYFVETGKNISLQDFSMSVNDVKSNEKIYFYFLGIEDDELTPEANNLAELAIGLTVALLGELKHPVASVSAFALENLVGEGLEWWQEADVMGEYAVVLEPNNHWLVGNQYRELSTNGNIEITYTILSSSDIEKNIIVEDNTHKEVQFVLVNNTQTNLVTFFISPQGSPSWGPNWLGVPLPPNQSRSFNIPSGLYDIRVESENNLSWEKSLPINQNENWSLTD